MKTQIAIVTLFLMSCSINALAESKSATIRGNCLQLLADTNALIKDGKVKAFEKAQSECQIANGRLCGVYSIVVSTIAQGGACSVTAVAAPIDPASSGLAAASDNQRKALPAGAEESPVAPTRGEASSAQ